LKLSRQEEVDYLSKNGVHYSWEKPNIRLTKDFGTSVGGKETLTSNQPLPSDAYPLNYKRRRRKSYATI
jgi:argininosuccinate synthase